MGVLAELVPRRCSGTNREDGQCGRPSIPGGTVCTNHGGKAPQTREAARRRLLAGADLAIDHLLGMLEPRPPCETCGRSDADRDPVRGVNYYCRAADLIVAAHLPTHNSA